MATYKITLTPLGKFFFGGENVFGQEGAQDNRRRSYLVRSNLLPQQTTLLGMLREQLLAQNGLLLHTGSTQQEVADAQKLVGTKGFDLDTPSNYGVIEKISPILLEDDAQNIWQPTGFDNRQMEQKDNGKQWLKVEKNDDANRYFLENLNPKEELSLQFIQSGGETKALGKFFKPVSQTGVNITNRQSSPDKTDDKEGLYRQTFQSAGTSSFSNNTGRVSFVFYVQMNNAISNWKFADNTIQLGGERSTFRMQVTAMDNLTDLEDCLSVIPYGNGQQLSGLSRIILLSDSFADWATLKPMVELAITEVTPFRYFTTVLAKETRFYDLRKGDKTARKQSGLLLLLSRGSVLYTTQPQAVATELNKYPEFKKIGYNFFKLN